MSSMKKFFFALILIAFITDSYSQTGFRIRQLANINTHLQNGRYSALWGWTAPGGREYAILGCFTGTAFIDITDTANIHEVDFLPAPTLDYGNSWREMKTFSHYCYIVSEASDSYIQIADMQYLPDSIHYTGQAVFPNHSFTHSISQSGPYLYLNGGSSEGTAVVDLSVNPEAPVLRDEWNNLYVHDSRIVNDTIWACNIYNGKVTVINALNKDNLVTIRDWINLPVPNAPHNIAFTANMNYAFVTDETMTPAPGRMKIWDVSDLENITYLNSFDSSPFEKSIVHNVEVYGDFAFTAYYTAGVKVLNISNPVNPVEIGWFDSYPENNNSIYQGCWGVYYFPSGKIIISDESRGLFVLKPDLSNQITGIPKTNFTASDLQVIKRDSIRLIDMTEGIPSAWQWTVTGPENAGSSLKNPNFAFHTEGQYTVKLRSSNSSGSDSVTKVNLFRIINPPLSPFLIVNPPPGSRFITSQNDTGKVLFNWEKSYNSEDIFYKIISRKVGESAEDHIIPGRNGRDTFMLVNKSYLDSMALKFGLSGDSVIVQCRVRAYNGSDSLNSNATIIIIKRNTVGIQNISEEIPGEFKLYDNYPNPFNPITTIKFDLPKSTLVSLTLYDISGREVLNLVNRILSAGSYKYKLNAENLTSGIYIVRFITEKFNSSKRIVLLK